MPQAIAARFIPVEDERHIKNVAEHIHTAMRELLALKTTWLWRGVEPTYNSLLVALTDLQIQYKTTTGRTLRFRQSTKQTP